MTNKHLKTIVEKEQADLLDGHETVEQAVELRAKRGTVVAQGLLSLGRSSEANKWFSALHNEWLLWGEEIWEKKFEKCDDETAQMKPWREYHMSLLTGLLGDISLEDAARTSHGRVTEPLVDDLKNRKLSYRIDLVGLLSSYVLDKPDYKSFEDNLRAYVEQNGDSRTVAYYLPYAQVIQGLSADDKTMVRDGIEDFLDYHEEYIVGSPDTGFYIEELALDAAAMLVLARREGMDIEIESEYLPEALTDEEYYPVGD